MSFKKGLLIGFFLSLIYLIIHLAVINDYGLSWDFHYVLYEGLYHLGLPVPSPNSPPPVPFTPPDPRLTLEDPFGPVLTIIPAFFYNLLYARWHILPADASYNLPTIIFGSFGVGLLFMFIYESLGLGEALFSSVFLALLPIYFGYLHTDMKDIPNAFFFSLCLYLFWRLTKKGTIGRLIAATAAFGIAFNMKINSAFAPVVNFLWYVLTYPRDIFKRAKIVIWSYFFLSPVAAILIWWPFWRNPLGKLMELPYYFSHNTLNMPVFFLGNIYHSGVNIPWYYPYIYIFISTPLPILAAFIIGAMISIGNLRKNKIYLLLILWFWVPIWRFFIPSVAAIDGIRHFLEIVYPISAIAGVGAVWIYEKIRILLRFPRSFSLSPKSFYRGSLGMPWLPALIFGLVFILPLVYNIVHFHPYETSYFNIIAGGIRGANGRFDINFWGEPQKKVMLWLNRNAGKGVIVNVVMAQASAGVYLREDLLKNLNTKSIWESDYVVILNRQSFSTDDIANYLRQKIAEKKIVYEISIDGVPLVWVLKK